MTAPDHGEPQYPQQQYPQYPQQPYPSYPPTPSGYGPQGQQSNGLAIAAMVCGIVGLVVAAIILGPLAIIFGVIGLGRANRGAPGRRMATAGIVLGIIDVIIFIILIVWVANHGGFVV